MKERKAHLQTLAAALDRTKWDYSPETDRSFLLSSVERAFASVAWEISSQHLAPMAVDSSAGTPAGHETQPLEKLIGDR